VTARSWEDAHPSSEKVDDMTDPTSPNHDQPAEGPRDSSYSAPDPAATGPSNAAKAGDVLESIREAVEDFAEKAAPTVRQFSAKAAEIVATAADKAAPLAQKAGEVTADASGKLAEKSRTWAAEVRDSLNGNDDAKPGSSGTSSTTKDDAGTTPPSVG
jgi:hypothetical protein